MAVSEQVLNPIVIQDLEAFGQNFQEFVIQVRQKDNYAISWTKTAAGRKVGLKWKSLPCVFDQTIKGRNYEVRVAVREANSDAPAFTTWKTVSAGDTTPPAAIGTITATAKEGAVKFSFTYTKPVDFKEFQWKVNIGANSEPSDDDIYVTTTDPQLVVPSTADDIIYIWVRPIDQAGNANSWVAKSGTVSKVSAAKVATDATNRFVSDSQKTRINQSLTKSIIWSDSTKATGGGTSVGTPTTFASTTGWERKVLFEYAHESNIKTLELNAHIASSDGVNTATARIVVYTVSNGGVGTSQVSGDTAGVKTTAYTKVSKTIDVSGLVSGKSYIICIYLNWSGQTGSAYMRLPEVSSLGA